MDKRLGSPFIRPISVIEVRCIGRSISEEAILTSPTRDQQPKH